MSNTSLAGKSMTRSKMKSTYGVSQISQNYLGGRKKNTKTFAKADNFNLRNIMKRSNVPEKARSPTMPASIKRGEAPVFKIQETGYFEEIETPSKRKKTLAQVPSSKIMLDVENEKIGVNAEDPENIYELENINDERDKNISETSQRSNKLKARNTVQIKSSQPFDVHK